MKRSEENKLYGELPDKIFKKPFLEKFQKAVTYDQSIKNYKYE